MIFCNLKVLLAERNISISKMSLNTGISRTTITALCSNKSSGILFDTLNSICSYLNVLPDEVILFSPYKFDFKSDKTNNLLVMEIKNLITKRSFYIDLIVEIDKFDLYFNHYSEDETNFNKLLEIISTLPTYYISSLNEQIVNIVKKDYNNNELGELDSFNFTTNLY